MTARRLSALCVVVGALLLCSGILAGLVNRQILDGPRFAQHADAVRRDPAVAQQVGQAITRRVLAADPDLVAVRPLIESAATALAASTTFGPIVRASARQFHQAFTQQNSGQVVLRLADLGAVITAVVPTISPRAGARLPPDLDVTLAHVGQQSFAARTIHLAHLVGLLSWLLPVLALSAFGVGLWLAPDRLRGTIRTGWAVLAAGAGVSVVALVGSLAASVADEATLRGALIAASWRVLSGAVWWAAGITVAAGALLVAAATARIPQFDLTTAPRQVWIWVSRRPAGRWARIARGAALVVVGAGAALRPDLVFGIVGVLVGMLLCLAGIGEIAAAAGARRLPAAADPAPRSRRVPALALAAAVLLLIGLVAVDAAPTDRQVSASTADASIACNGHVELCVRRYSDVAFPATHNAMSAADEPGWFIPEQPTGLIGQLDAGIRVLLIDTWYGQATDRPGLVATAPGSHADALAEAERLYGRDVVASALRVRDALSPKPTGPVRPYLCHGLCEIGATDFEPVMAQVRSWLLGHPREVVTFFIEDSVSPTDTARVFEQVGLLPYVHTQQPGQPWPTLGEMIDSGRRVVVLMERHGGESSYPWLLQGFDWVQDTPFTNPSAADLSCSLNRGSTSSPLLLVNYWLSSFRSLITDARTINAFHQLSPYLAQCRRERGRIPNFVAVNYFNEGDLLRAVDQLNGLS